MSNKELNLGEGLNSIVQARLVKIKSLKHLIDTTLDNDDKCIMFTECLIQRIIGISNDYKLLTYNRREKEIEELSNSHLGFIIDLLEKGFYSVVSKTQMFSDTYRCMWIPSNRFKYYNVDSLYNEYKNPFGKKFSSHIRDIINPLKNDKFGILDAYLIHYTWNDVDDNAHTYHPIEIYNDRVVMYFAGTCQEEGLKEFALYCNEKYPSIYNGEYEYHIEDYGKRYPNSYTLFFTEEAKGILGKINGYGNCPFPIGGTYYNMF